MDPAVLEVILDRVVQADRKGLILVLAPKVVHNLVRVQKVSDRADLETSDLALEETSSALVREEISAPAPRVITSARHRRVIISDQHRRVSSSEQHRRVIFSVQHRRVISSVQHRRVISTSHHLKESSFSSHLKMTRLLRLIIMLPLVTIRLAVQVTHSTHQLRLMQRPC